MSIFPRPLKKVLDKIVPFSQEDKIPLFNLGSGTYDATTVLKGDGTWGTPGGMGYVPYVGATQDVDLGIYKLTADAVEFSLTPTNAPGAGQIVYDGASGALSYLLNSSNVLSRIGQTMHAYVHNGEAVTITKGQAVYLFSASGNKASVKLAYNTSDATSAKTFGLAAEDIGAGQNGMVICQGVIDGLNTVMYTAGDTLYLGATPGDYTNVKPYAPNHFVYVGIVERANAGNGQIYVRVQNGYEMDEIHDVDLITTPPISGDVLTYNGTLWTAQAPSSGSGTVTSVATSAPITGGPITTSGTIGITQATTSTDGYLSSTDWNTFNGKQDLLISGTNIKTINSTSLLGSGDITINGNPSLGIVTGTNVTGVTAMTKSATITLPANTISAISILEIEARAIRVATLTGTIAFQVYINTSDSLTGATLLGVFNSMTTSNWFTQGRRSLFINPTINTLICVNTGTTVATDFTSTGANGSITFNETLTYYLIFAVQPSSTATTAVVQYAFAKRYV